MTLDLSQYGRARESHRAQASYGYLWVGAVGLANVAATYLLGAGNRRSVGNLADSGAA